MSHAGSRVGDNSHNEEVDQVIRDMEGALPQDGGQVQIAQNGEIRGAAPANQGPPLQPQPYQPYPQYPPQPYQPYPPQPYPQYYPLPPPQYPPHQQYQQPPRPPQQPVVREDLHEEEYDDQEPTMGELSAPNFRNQSWCIYEGPDLEAIAINTAVVHHLPKFSGTRGESATAHLQRYHGICQNLRPYGVEVEDFKLKAFYFSLIDSANDWFLSLPAGSIHTWDQMQKKFLNKYYPAGRAMQVRRQLQELRQGPNETMYEYVEKFNALEQSCCNLGLPEKLIVEYMLDGLRRLDRKLLDASAGGTIMNLSPAGVRRKIMEVAENARFQDESNKEEEFSRTRNVSKVEPPSSSMAEEIKQLKEMMQQVIRRQPIQARPCEFCGATDHKTDSCPTLVEDDQGEVNAVGDYQSYGNRAGPNRQYGPATSGQGANGQNWRNDNHQHYAQREPAQPAAPQQAQQYYRPPYRQQQGGQNGPGQYQQRQDRNQSGLNQHGSSKSLEDIVKDLATSVHQFQAKTDGAIADLSKQMSQIATTVSELKNDPGRLSSQTIQNPRGNVSAVTLRSGKHTTAASTRLAENDSLPTTEKEPVGTEILGTSGPDTLSASVPGPTPVTETF